MSGVVAVVATAAADDAPYALTRGSQAHRLARWMAGVRLPGGAFKGRWVSQLRAAVELHICEIHPRLPDIERAGGVVRMREVRGPDGALRCEYTLVRVPRVRGLTQADVDAIRIEPPDDGPMDWVPPPRIDPWADG